MNEYREEFIDLLQLLASKEKQDEYQKNVPHVNIAQELICMCFDDFYYDGTHLKNYFNDEETKILKEFHEYYEERVKRLPNSYAEFWHSSLWKEIVQKAEETLKKIKSNDSNNRP